MFYLLPYIPRDRLTSEQTVAFAHPRTEGSRTCHHV